MTSSRAARGALKIRNLVFTNAAPESEAVYVLTKPWIDSKGTCFATNVTSELEEEHEAAYGLMTATDSPLRVAE